MHIPKQAAATQAVEICYKISWMWVCTVYVVTVVQADVAKAVVKSVEELGVCCGVSYYC
jgi:hypothetical protein